MREFTVANKIAVALYRPKTRLDSAAEHKNTQRDLAKLNEKHLQRHSFKRKVSQKKSLAKEKSRKRKVSQKKSLAKHTPSKAPFHKTYLCKIDHCEKKMRIGLAITSLIFLSVVIIIEIGLIVKQVLYTAPVGEQGPEGIQGEPEEVAPSDQTIFTVSEPNFASTSLLLVDNTETKCITSNFVLIVVSPFSGSTGVADVDMPKIKNTMIGTAQNVTQRTMGSIVFVPNGSPNLQLFTATQYNPSDRILVSLLALY